MTTESTENGRGEIDTRWSGTGAVRIGLRATTALGIVLVGWGMFASLSGAVIAAGTVRVEGHRQPVQHPDGGVVSEILVRDGTVVAAGDVLLTLDGGALRSELEIVEAQYLDTFAQVARLRAERDGLSELSPPTMEPPSPALDAALAGQRNLLMVRQDALAEQLSQIDEQVRQIDHQVEGAIAQLNALLSEAVLVDGELEKQRSLLARQLVPARSVTSLEREVTRIDGEVGRIEAEIAQARGQAAELGIRASSLSTGRREEALAALREFDTRLSELATRRAEVRRRAATLEMRSPVDGVVTEMQIHALRSVIQPGEPVAHIVPQDDAFIVEARIETHDVDQLYEGQPATLRFSAFNQSTTPEIEGQVVTVSADSIVDPNTGAPYYAIEIAVLDSEAPLLEGVRVLPGMPVEAFVQTSARSPIGYLTKPLTDYFARALRE